MSCRVTAEEAFNIFGMMPKHPKATMGCPRKGSNDLLVTCILSAHKTGEFHLPLFTLYMRKLIYQENTFLNICYCVACIWIFEIQTAPKCAVWLRACICAWPHIISPSVFQWRSCHRIRSMLWSNIAGFKQRIQIALGTTLIPKVTIKFKMTRTLHWCVLCLQFSCKPPRFETLTPTACLW